MFYRIIQNRKQLITPKNIKVYLLVSLKNSLINALTEKTATHLTIMKLFPLPSD